MTEHQSKDATKKQAIDKKLDKIEALRRQNIESLDKIAGYMGSRTDEILQKITAKIERCSEEVDNLLKWYGRPLCESPAVEMEKIKRRDEKIEEEIRLIKAQVGLLQGTEVVEASEPQVTDVRLVQAFSYTVFDTILFSITRGAAPDFTLISQSALFDTVYVNISRGFESYLFNDVPAAAVAVIHQGRGILDELRETEDRYLDEPDLWDVYAPQIQSWWVNTALPLLFGERDPDWDEQPLPSHEEMKLWTEGEFSQRKHFPAVADLVEMAKERALAVSESYDFRILLNA